MLFGCPFQYIIPDCSELTYVNLSATLITSINLSQCTKLARIYFEKCKKLKSTDIENCKALKSIAMNNFDRCTEAEVKLSTSIIWIEEYAFGGGVFSWCKKVLVSNDAIKQLVIDSNYHDESRIEMY